MIAENQQNSMKRHLRVEDFIYRKCMVQIPVNLRNLQSVRTEIRERKATKT